MANADQKVNLPESEIHEFSDEEIPSKGGMGKDRIMYTEQKTRLAKVRMKMLFLINHHYFQIFVCVLVLLDTAVVVTEIMVETSNKDGTSNHQMELAEKVLHNISLTILSLFMLEILVKISAMGKDFFRHKFEIFDAIIVTLSFFLDIFLSSGGIKDGVEFLILLRLWRITRIINGIIVSIKTRAEERELKLKEEKDELLEKCTQCALKIEAQKREIQYLKERLKSYGEDSNLSFLENDAMI